MLITDLTGFTSFSDVTEPEYVFGSLAEYHGLVGEIVGSHDGEVIDVYGDGVFAVFASVTTDDATSRRAVETALDLHRQVGDLLSRWRKRGQHLGLKIALNIGFATFGPVRAGIYSRYAAVGSAVNATFQLARAVREGEILATNRVAEMAVGLAEVVARPDIELSSLRRPVDVFELRAIAKTL